jgi:VIT1/CCC1 family predicted Fe2+/Mn2+ transporter
MKSVNLRRFSFGTTSAIVTSMGMGVGLNAAVAPRSTIVSGLLIIAIADNISDSLSIHLYQESEGLEARAAFRATITNMFARFFATATFIALVVLVPTAFMGPVLLAWGLALLVGLTWLLARARNVPVIPEIIKHVAVAALVVLVSRAIGTWIRAYVG